MWAPPPIWAPPICPCATPCAPPPIRARPHTICAPGIPCAPPPQTLSGAADASRPRYVRERLRAGVAPTIPAPEDHSAVVAGLLVLGWKRGAGIRYARGRGMHVPHVATWMDLTPSPPQTPRISFHTM